MNHSEVKFIVCFNIVDYNDETPRITHTLNYIRENAKHK